MVPTLTLRIYQEEDQYDREQQIVHLTIHVLTSGKQSGHPGNNPRGFSSGQGTLSMQKIYGIRLGHF